MPLPSNRTFDVEIKDDVLLWRDDLGAPLPKALDRHEKVLGVLKVEQVGFDDYSIRSVAFPGILSDPWIPNDTGALWDCFGEEIRYE